MADKITIIVDRPACFWLPPMSNSDPEIDRPDHELCGKLLLRPGANTISLARWKLTENHPGVKMYVGLGVLRVNPSADGRAERTHAPDSDNGVGELTVVKAGPYIAACKDADQLVSWRAKDKRAGIHKLIDARLAELEDEGEGEEELDDDNDPEDDPDLED